MSLPASYTPKKQYRQIITLSSKQEIFTNEYIRTGDAQLAASVAGYKGPPSIYYKPEFAELVKERTELAKLDSLATGTDALFFLTQVMNGEVKDQFGLDATLKDRLDACKEILKRTVDLDIKAKERKEQANNEFHLSIDWSRPSDDTSDLNEISNEEVIIENEE